MKLDKLKIGKFRNLQDFSIDFDETSFTTVLIGQNGTGKSNLLEALITIFRDLDLGNQPEFKYELDYICRNHKISIEANPDNKKEVMRVTVNGEVISYRRFWKDSDRIYLPSYVFGYYSGTNNRMETLFKAHQNDFYSKLIGKDAEKGKHLRPLFYSRLVHSYFVLLAFFNEQDQTTLRFLEKQLRIKELDSVLFVMKHPPWKSSKGDPRFWYARGEVQKFLSKLYELALAPVHTKQSIELGFRETNKDVEHLYLYLQDVESLKKLASLYASQKDFFTALESTYISELISEVRIRIGIENVGKPLTYRDLSEGEQQLLMVLGLLHFTREDESLFLLDEPDTHLNPAWSIQYLDFLKEVVGNQDNSHIIMTTHNPLVIAGLKRHEIQIMRRDAKGIISARPPERDPIGMGVEAILTSDLFGLRSALDLATQRLLDRRRELAFKDGDLTEEERQELGELDQQLEGLDFTMRDERYEKFVRAMIEQEDSKVRQQVVLTPEQQAQQRKIAAEIIEKLMAEDE